MPRVNPDVLATADLAVQAAGALLAIVLAVRALRRHGLRNPLADVPPPGEGVGLLEVGLVLAGYLFVTGLAYQLAGVQAGDFARPGSASWNLAALIDLAVKVAICVLMVVLLSHDAFGGVGFGPDAGGSGPEADGGRVQGSARQAVLAGLAAGLIALPVCFVQLQACQWIWQRLWPETQPPVHTALRAIEHNAWGPAGVTLLVVGAVLIAPLSEELFFRGMLLQALWRRVGGPWRAIAGSALAFAAIHYPQPQTVVPLFTLGLILGYLRVRSRSLAACVLAHALFNARTIAIAVLNPQMVMQV